MMSISICTVGDLGGQVAQYNQAPVGACGAQIIIERVPHHKRRESVQRAVRPQRPVTVIADMEVIGPCAGGELRAWLAPEA
jgi:hypothetical protein